jgi:hypothetical protein
MYLTMKALSFYVLDFACQAKMESNPQTGERAPEAKRKTEKASSTNRFST